MEKRNIICTDLFLAYMIGFLMFLSILALIWMQIQSVQDTKKSVEQCEKYGLEYKKVTENTVYCNKVLIDNASSYKYVKEVAMLKEWE